MATDIDPIIQSVLPRVIELRHALHARPELGYEEVETAKLIRAELDRLQIKYTAGVENAATATIGLIGDSSKPCVALRADIDALPIVEQTGLPYASKNPGRMHACGHDGHTANLLGTAAVLKQIEATLPVCVKLIFQPAEEGGGGGGRLTEAGVLDGRIGPKVSRIFGLHGFPGLPTGVVATRPGALLAATDTFRANFVGIGCHGAMPHLGRDPIVAAAEAVVSLQSIVSRELDPTEPGVVTVGTFHAGTAVNIIPDSATIDGTIRTLTPATREKLRDAVKRRCEQVAAAHGCRAEVELRSGYPATINDADCVEYVKRITSEKSIAPMFLLADRPMMGGEDFSYYLEKVPGCFFFVGVIPEGRTDYPPLHSDRFDFTDAALPVCMRVFVELVRNAG